MFSYQNIQAYPKLLLAMTGLTEDEFANVLLTFTQVWEAYITQEYVNRSTRQRRYGAGQHATTLVTINDKLLFILYYLKVYPLQEILAFEFGMAQSTANAWIHLLTPILQETLERGGYLPERDATQVQARIEADGDDTYGIDGTERRCQRPQDPETQRACYSGKKKTHTEKNLVIGGLSTRTVVYLSDTYEGRVHDKRIADTEQPTLPEEIALYKDTGFQGYEPEHVLTFQPQKKPRGKELSQEQKAENRLISKVRIVIEHLIAGIKRCRIVKDVFRNTKVHFDDLVMELACGLHNFRVHFRTS
jgi:hypothetical protein